MPEGEKVVLFPAQKDENQACFHGGCAHHRSPPVLDLGTGTSIIPIPGCIPEIKNVHQFATLFVRAGNHGNSPIRRVELTEAAHSSEREYPFPEQHGARENAHHSAQHC